VFWKKRVTVMTGKLDKSYGRLISRLYELRQSGDYDDKFDATKEEILPFFEQVEKLLKEIENLIARSMKVDGMPFEQIAKYTGLSVEEIENL